jgi:hypothetical protein
MPDIQLPDCIRDWEVDLDCFRNCDNEIEYHDLNGGSVFLMTFNVRPKSKSNLRLCDGFSKLNTSLYGKAVYVTVFGHKFDVHGISIPIDQNIIKLHTSICNLEFLSAQRVAVEFYSLLTSVPVPRGAMQNYRHPVIHYIDHETREPWYAKTLTFLESLMPL